MKLRSRDSSNIQQGLFAAVGFECFGFVIEAWPKTNNGRVEQQIAKISKRTQHWPVAIGWNERV